MTVIKQFVGEGYEGGRCQACGAWFVQSFPLGCPQGFWHCSKCNPNLIENKQFERGPHGWENLSKDKLEREVLALLMEITSLGRNGRPYRHLLSQLRAALNMVPHMKRAIAEALGEHRNY